MRQSDLRSQEQQIQTQRLRMQQEEASLETDRYNLSKVRIESPINGIVTRRNIEEGEMVVIGTMNNAGTVLLTIADMSVIEAEVDVDETDIPERQARPDRQDHDRRAFPTRRSPGRSPRSATARSRRPGRPRAQATNFKVVVTLDTEIPDVRPGFTCTAEITTATRERRAWPCRSRRRRFARWSSTTRATIVRGAGERPASAAAVGGRSRPRS